SGPVDLRSTEVDARVVQEEPGYGCARSPHGAVRLGERDGVSLRVDHGHVRGLAAVARHRDRDGRGGPAGCRFEVRGGRTRAVPPARGPPRLVHRPPAPLPGGRIRIESLAGAVRTLVVEAARVDGTVDLPDGAPGADELGPLGRERIRRR